MARFKFGSVVKDEVTGFTGKVTGRYEGLDEKSTKVAALIEGKIVEQWITTKRLSLLEEGKETEATKEE